VPTTYKGLVIPLSSDMADGPAAFRDYTDSLPASEAVLSTALPAGFLGWTCAATAPVGWLLLDGATVAGGQTLYPKLWAVVPVGWQSGVDLILPDCRGRLVIGRDPADTNLDVVGDKTGGKTVTLVAGNLPPHPHVQQGTVTTGGASARHRHGSTGGGQFVETAFAAGLQLAGGSGAVGANLTNTDTPDHTHQATLSGNTGNGPGTSVPVNIMPPVMAFNVVIRAV